MTKLIAITFSLSLLSAVTTIQAADITRGKELHDQNCLKCHQDIMSGKPNNIYIRDNRRIESYAALIKQVGRCKDNLDIPWPEDQVMDVVEYLNHHFYHFKGL